MIKLQETHSENNPTAKIPIETITKKMYKNKARCFRTETNIEPISLLCKGASVEINGKNLNQTGFNTIEV
jgi:hypothetical protein